MKRHTSQEWLDYFGYEMIDPDGWRANGETVENPVELILTEFVDRLNDSTICNRPGATYYNRREVLDFLS
jgi:hypothetical protein